MKTYEIFVVNRKESFHCPPGQGLLQGMEKVGCQAINIGCRGGGCGMCKVRIVKGAYSTKRMSRAHVSEEEMQEGYALACRVIPMGDLCIESDHFELKKETHPYREE